MIYLCLVHSEQYKIKDVQTSWSKKNFHSKSAHKTIVPYLQPNVNGKKGKRFDNGIRTAIVKNNT